MTRPATSAATLFAAVDMAIPIVNNAEPNNIVFLRPNLSAKKAPVSRDPAKAPAWMEAVIPPWRKLLG